MTKATQSTVLDDEISHFSAQAEDWWKSEGQFAPLHRMNPARLGYLRDQICAHFGRKAGVNKPLMGISILLGSANSMTLKTKHGLILMAIKQPNQSGLY